MWVRCARGRGGERDVIAARAVRRAGGGSIRATLVRLRDSAGAVRGCHSTSIRLAGPATVAGPGPMRSSNWLGQGTMTAIKWLSISPVRGRHRCSFSPRLRGTRHACHRSPGVRLLCFHPDPVTTRGEARYIGTMAARLDWHSVILVTTPDQAWRARLPGVSVFPREGVRRDCAPAVMGLVPPGCLSVARIGQGADHRAFLLRPLNVVMAHLVSRHATSSV